MIRIKKYLVAFVFLCQLLFQDTGCQKEFTHNGIDSTNAGGDSAIVPPPPVVNDFPPCALCNSADTITLSHWSFKKSNSFFCGVINSADFSANRTAFTFFGPSACSADTGLVVTIYLPEVFDSDKFNITTTSIDFLYYDRFGTKDIFLSLPERLFTVNIESYIYSTGIATGTFRGFVFKANGDTTFLDEGNFMAKLK